jgi:hypothetical protein
MYFVMIFFFFLAENKRKNKEAGSQIKQHWLATCTSLTRMTSPDTSLINWGQTCQPEQPDQPDGTWRRSNAKHMVR